jgi:hypothetical protein
MALIGTAGAGLEPGAKDYFDKVVFRTAPAAHSRWIASPRPSDHSIALDCCVS